MAATFNINVAQITNRENIECMIRLINELGDESGRADIVLGYMNKIKEEAGTINTAVNG